MIIDLFRQLLHTLITHEKFIGNPPGGDHALAQVIDGLRDEIKSRHIDRLRDGRCTIELGFILCDILTNYERVSDHCSNLAACLIKSAEQSFETHKFLSEMKDPSNTEYKSEYENFGKKYAI